MAPYFGLADVMLLAHVVVPVHAFGEETVRAVMVLGRSAQDGQAVEFALAAADRIASRGPTAASKYASAASAFSHR